MWKWTTRNAATYVNWFQFWLSFQVSIGKKTFKNFWTASENHKTWIKKPLEGLSKLHYTFSEEQIWLNFFVSEYFFDIPTKNIRTLNKKNRLVCQNCILCVQRSILGKKWKNKQTDNFLSDFQRKIFALWVKIFWRRCQNYHFLCPNKLFRENRNFEKKWIFFRIWAKKFCTVSQNCIVLG